MRWRETICTGWSVLHHGAEFKNLYWGRKLIAVQGVGEIWNSAINGNCLQLIFNLRLIAFINQRYSGGLGQRKVCGIRSPISLNAGTCLGNCTDSSLLPRSTPGCRPEASMQDTTVAPATSVHLFELWIALTNYSCR